MNEQGSTCWRCHAEPSERRFRAAAFPRMLEGEEGAHDDGQTPCRARLPVYP